MKPQRRTNKKQHIIQTAIDLFSRFGAKRVSVEEICRTARVSKVTFYKYFKNKIALVRHIRDLWTEEGFAKFDEINTRDLPFMEKINLMTRWKVEFFSRVNAEFIRELVSLDEVVEEAKRRFLGTISRAQKTGEVRKDIDPALLWLVTEKLTEITKQGLWKKIFNDYGEYQRQVRTLVFFGLLSRPEKDA